MTLSTAFWAFLTNFRWQKPLTTGFENNIHVNKLNLRDLIAETWSSVLDPKNQDQNKNTSIRYIYSEAKVTT